MIDIKILRSNPELVRDSIEKRNLKFDLDRLLFLDEERLAKKQEVEVLQAVRNKVSKEIPTLSDATEKQTRIAEMKEVGEKIAEMEKDLETTKDEYELMFASLPNFLDPTAAIGPDDSGNVVESTYGTPRTFDFPVKAHYEIGEARGWIDIEKGAEVSGARFWYLKGDLVLLQFAIMQYVINEMVKKGFMPVIPPYLVREPAMYGT